MFTFHNSFTGARFTGTVVELFYRLTGEHETIFDKSDVIKSYGWSWNETKMIV